MPPLQTIQFALLREDCQIGIADALVIDDENPLTFITNGDRKKHIFERIFDWGKRTEAQKMNFQRARDTFLTAVEKNFGEEAKSYLVAKGFDVEATNPLTGYRVKRLLDRLVSWKEKQEGAALKYLNRRDKQAIIWDQIATWKSEELEIPNSCKGILQERITEKVYREFVDTNWKGFEPNDMHVPIVDAARSLTENYCQNALECVKTWNTVRGELNFAPNGNQELSDLEKEILWNWMLQQEVFSEEFSEDAWQKPEIQRSLAIFATIWNQVHTMKGVVTEEERAAFLKIAFHAVVDPSTQLGNELPPYNIKDTAHFQQVITGVISQIADLVETFSTHLPWVNELSAAEFSALVGSCVRLARSAKADRTHMANFVNGVRHLFIQQKMPPQHSRATPSQRFSLYQSLLTPEVLDCYNQCSKSPSRSLQPLGNRIMQKLQSMPSLSPQKTSSVAFNPLENNGIRSIVRLQAAGKAEDVSIAYSLLEKRGELIRKLMVEQGRNKVYNEEALSECMNFLGELRDLEKTAKSLDPEVQKQLLFNFQKYVISEHQYQMGQKLGIYEEKKDEAGVPRYSKGITEDLWKNIQDYAEIKYQLTVLRNEDGDTLIAKDGDVGGYTPYTGLSRNQQNRLQAAVDSLFATLHPNIKIQIHLGDELVDQKELSQQTEDYLTLLSNDCKALHTATHTLPTRGVSRQNLYAPTPERLHPLKEKISSSEVGNPFPVGF